MRDAFNGKASSHWVLQFVERVFAHPESLAAAKFRGGTNWMEWYGYSLSVQRTCDLTDVVLAGLGAKQTSVRPTFVTETQPDTLEAACSRLLSMQTMNM